MTLNTLLKNELDRCISYLESAKESIKNPYDYSCSVIDRFDILDEKLNKVKDINRSYEIIQSLLNETILELEKIKKILFFR